MAFENTYTGNGSTTTYSFTFEYLLAAHVKVTLDGVATTAFTFPTVTSVQFNTAPANGSAIRIFRDTAVDTLQATFFAGSTIAADDLNNNFSQVLYVSEETEGLADSIKVIADTAVTTANGAVTTANSAVTSANSAVTSANSAVTTANGAVTTANAADAKSDTAIADSASAVTTANTASTTASAAVTTANTASTNASAAVTTANTANTNASAAVTTANTASTNASAAVTTANAADTKADTAITNSAAAVTTANAADTKADTAIIDSAGAVDISSSVAATVAGLLPYAPVANIAAIPASPADGDRVEVEDSTGAGASALITGLPSGFTGNSSAVLRLEYDAANTIWNFKQYLYRDPDSRYIEDNAAQIVDADVNASAAIGLSKLATGALPAAITIASTNIVDGTIVNADVNESASIADTKLDTISTAGKVSNSATTATTANTASAIVSRDGSGNFSAGTVTASLTGDVTGDVTGNVTGDLTGNADTATNSTQLNGQAASYYLNASNISSGTIDDARLPSTISSNITGNVTGDLTGVASSANEIKRATWSGSSTWKDLAAWSSTSDSYHDLANATSGYVQISGTGKLRASDNITAASFTGTLGNSQVRTAIASSSVGTVGTYAFCGLRNNTADKAAGTTTSGSNLRYSNADAAESGTPSGSWRLMGRLAGNSGQDTTQETSLWLRYA